MGLTVKISEFQGRTGDGAGCVGKAHEDSGMARRDVHVVHAESPARHTSHSQC